MLNGLIGEKLGMTQFFDDTGRSLPITVVKVDECRVVQIKTKENDDYDAVQLGMGKTKKSRQKSPQKGHFAKAGMEVPSKKLKEIRCSDTDGLTLGDEVGVDLFKDNDLVDVTGISVGKGFAGVMKRWNFKGGPMKHGSRIHRLPGSIGARAIPGKVVKGKKMPGQYGNKKVTVQKLRIVKVDADKKVLLIKGSIPGPRGCMVIVRKSVKGR